MSAAWSRPLRDGPFVLLERFGGAPRSGRRAAFLDRDGTLNAAVLDPASGTQESPLRLQDVELLAGAAAAASRLAAADFALVCVTNQPAAAKGKIDVEQLLAIHERVIGLLAREGVRIEASWLCPHHPAGVAGPLTRKCACRKPAPGMLAQAATALGIELDGSWMIGDTDSDVLAGRAAGAQALLLEYPPSAHKRSGEVVGEFPAADLSDAARKLVQASGRAFP